MKIEINIDEHRINKAVEKEIVSKVMERRTAECWEAKQGIRKGIESAVRELIYAEKSNIIDAVVKRASVEIIKKGLPKLLAELGKGEE